MQGTVGEKKRVKRLWHKGQINQGTRQQSFS
jgi:hypothetical protein